MRVPVESRLTIRDIDPRTGVVVRERVGPNLITDIGIQSFVALLGGGFGFPTVGENAYEPRTLVRPGTTGCFIGEMQLGQALAVGVVSPSDTSLAGPAAFTGRSYASPATMTVSYPGLGEVAFTVRIPATEHNGELFTEEGLFTHDGDLVARRIIEPAWRKPDGLETEFTHTLRFGRTARALDVVSTIDVSPDVLGALRLDAIIGGFLDISPDILGDLAVGVPPIPANLLYNPSFDILPAMTGWTLIGSGWTVSAAGGIYPAPISPYAAAGPNAASGEAYQIVELATWASAIDAGNAALYFEGYGTASNESTPDQTRFLVEVYDGAGGTGSLLTSLDTGNFGTPFIWTKKTLPFMPLPAFARSVKVRVLHTRFSGVNLNALSDETALELHVLMQSANLIVNPDFEAPISAPWTPTLGAFVQRTGPSGYFPAPQNGSYFAGPTTAGNSELYQDIDVSAYAADIDKGLVRYDFTGWEYGGGPFPNDSCSFRIECRDVGSSVLNTWDSGFYTAAIWAIQARAQALPVGTRTIRVRLVATRNGSIDPNCYSYFDNLDLKLTHPTP